MAINPKSLKNLKPGQSPGRTPGKTPPTTTVTVRIPNDILAAIDAAAAEKGTTRSAEIIQSLADLYTVTQD